jgi:LPS-assembly protein
MLEDKVQDKCQNFAYRLIRSYAMSSGSFCKIYNTMAHLALMLVVLSAVPVYADEPANISPTVTIGGPSDSSTYYEGDEIEPNNSLAHANSVDAGVSIKGQLSSEKDEDWFSITTSGAGVITANFNVGTISSGRWDIFIEDASGNVLSAGEYDASSSSDPTKTFVAVAEAGTYYIIIKAYSYFYYGDDHYTLMVSVAQDPLSGDRAVEPWNIVADEISYDQEADQYIARGNVVITKEDRKLTADFVRFDHKTMKALAKGNVIMTAGEDILTASSMEMDLEAETGTAYNGTIFLKANHFYIKGNKIQKVGKYSYVADRASITTCDGDTPAWKITGRNLKVTIEGYGFVNHAALWAKKVPVLYTPFLVFPAKLRRQSGLLPPQIGYSDRKGAEYIQPFYWAISESSDATFYEDHMGFRGEKLGLEYRYILDEQSKGTLMYDFLDDRKVDDGTPGSSENWGYEDDSVLRPNSDRYWLRMKHDQSMPFGFSARLDIDIVSDQDYLYEFDSGYTGFYTSDKYFINSFGRGFDDYDDPVRVNRLNLNRSWSTYSFNAEARWYDDVINRRQSDTNTILQKLPFAEFNASKHQILNTPLFFDFDSEYVRFYLEDSKRGHRIDALPRLYLPLKFKNYFSLEPSFGWRQTAWNVERYQDPSIETNRTLYREIYDIKLDLSSEIYNIYSLKGRGIERIRHAVRPQIVYEFIPDQDQDEYPSFDDLDRISEKSLITYSITNTFTSRSRKYSLEQGTRQEDKDDEPTYTYNEFCRFKLEQSYDINKANENDPEPFSPVYGELQVNPGRYLSLQADAEWSQYENDFLSHNVAANIWDKRGDRLFAEHRYKRDSSRSIYYHLLLKVSDRLSAYTERERNLYDSKDIRSSVGLLYKAQCWSMELSYTAEENDRRYVFMINLYGLGEFGTQMGAREMETLFQGEQD